MMASAEQARAVVVADVPTKSSQRISALDFTKGALVLIMVLYHWINYFTSSQDNRYLRFLTPSFIFITGFLISNVYLSKYEAFDAQVPRRLMQRGLKLLGVFAALNVGKSVLSSHGQIASFIPSEREFFDVYIVGNAVIVGQGKAVAFFILVPISYLLILSALLLFVTRFYRYTFHVVCGLFLFGIALLYFRGLQSPNLELISIGLLGVLVGLLPIEKVNALVQHPYWLAIGYVIYLGLITRWNVISTLQIMGVCLSLMIIYLLGLHGGEKGSLQRCVILLGKYSLFGYIAQIAILQVLRAGLRHVGSESAVLVASFVLA